MFAFVIWDKEKRELFGARDIFGIKPLYYAQMNGTLLFGSEIKSFLHHPHFVKELNEKALENYLSFQYSPGPETFFKNVYKMPQGHYFKYKDGKMELTRYWIPTFQPRRTRAWSTGWTKLRRPLTTAWKPTRFPTWRWALSCPPAWTAAMCLLGPCGQDLHRGL